MHFSVFLIALILVLPLFSVSRVDSTETHQVRMILLHADKAQGWNYSIPGPPIQIIVHEWVIFTLEAHDHVSHESFCDDVGGLLGGFWLGFSDGNFTFSLPDEYNYVTGNFSYIDRNYPNCSGRFIVRPDIPEFVSAYGSRLNSSQWNDLADFDGNGIVTLTDLVSYAKLYGDKGLWNGPLPSWLEP